jgi:cytoskeleton protein RodZ
MMGKEEGSADIGARLRAARERKGLTVLQSAEKLHMDARLLEALESGDFASLGADVYVRGHLRRYADLIGESGADLQALYSGATPATTPDLTRIPRADHHPESSRLLLPALIAVVALALAGVVWWLVSLPRSKSHPMAVTAQPLNAPAATGAGPEPAAPSPDLTDNAATAAPATAAAAVPVAVTPDTQVHLALKFAEASWIKIWDAHDAALVDGLMASGTSRTVDGTPPLRLVIGNARAVGLAVNGQVVSLDSMVRRRGDARIAVDASGQVSASTQSVRGD